MKPSSKYIHSSTDLSKRKNRFRRKLTRLFCQVEQEPIFVLGNHKSGTSAVAGLLGERVGLPTTIDLPSEMECPTFHRVRQGAFSFQDFIQKNKLEFSRKIIKVPELIFLYPDLKAFFSKARFVFIVRDPRDNIRSILNRLKIPGQLSTIDRREYPEVTPTWELALDNTWLDMPSHHYIDALAARWSYIAQIYLRNSGNFVLVRYEDFCNHKLNQLDALAQKIALDTKHDVSRWLDYQFQPKGNQHISWQDFFGENLSRIETICQQEMNLLGYTPQLLEVR